uniref:Obg-like ATPase 1 n=1 Tax=Borrelia puertoricensis TaxID=2756107 RepID=A0AA51YN35_9SPIR|nr:Obg-like ATPase 1 [Borrelia puertoricensis]
MLKSLEKHLMDVRPVIEFEFDEFGYNFIKSLNLLTIKKVIYVCNVDENSLCGNKYTDTVKNIALDEGNNYLILCAKLEAELIEIKDLRERKEMLESMGINDSGLSNLIRTTYYALGLRTYFTAGEQEVRAWTFMDGMKAPEAAGLIHSDFQRGFIKAEVYSFNDLIEYQSVQCVPDNFSRSWRFLNGNISVYLLNRKDDFVLIQTSHGLQGWIHKNFFASVKDSLI